MALPTLTNASIASIPRPDLLPNGLSFTDGTVTTNTLPQYTSFAAASPTIGTANLTCNLTSDTLLFRADGAIWDDTQTCWISIDKTNVGPTPKK